MKTKKYDPGFDDRQDSVVSTFQNVVHVTAVLSLSDSGGFAPRVRQRVTWPSFAIFPRPGGTRLHGAFNIHISVTRERMQKGRQNYLNKNKQIRDILSRLLNASASLLKKKLLTAELDI